MNQTTSVYAEIYDIVNENMNRSGKEFPYNKNTFLCDVGSHPQDIFVSRYLQLSNEDFTEAMYVAALKRLPDDRTRAFWATKYDMPKEEFQEEILQCLAKSSVVAINHIRLMDNPYFEQKRGFRYKALGLLYGLTDKSNLREFGKKLPDPVQQAIRKVFL